MVEEACFNIKDSLYTFLQETDSNYRQRLIKLPLFDPSQTACWTHAQKKHFAAVFFHLRGHFINMLWYIANFSNDGQTKQLIMHNIHEELGLKNAYSHEQLYARFAAVYGVDINKELIDELHYLPFAKAFNKEHLRWLSTHDTNARLAAFAAYERLDNIDYVYLAELANSLGISQHDATFFNVHVHVKHFDATLPLICQIWEIEEETVENAFAFIYKHQYIMWRDLSEAIFAFNQS